MMKSFVWIVCLVFAGAVELLPVHADEKARTDSKSSVEVTPSASDAHIAEINEQLQQSLSKQLSELSTMEEGGVGAIDAYSKRGDLHMFLADFKKAKDDYLQMVKLRPDVDTSHWRLGIALYFADEPERAAAQFDKYHSFDNIDRENGIWRYLSHRRAFGLEKARQQLLKYETDDRPPFKEVYQLFDGSLTPTDVLKAIPEGLPESARNSRLFYSHLYVGLNHSAEGQNELAVESLRLATLNPWPRTAGFGPDYMWHVGRLQLKKLITEAKSSKQP